MMQWSPLLCQKKEKNMRFLVCLLIMAMDICAGILGIKAEIAQNKTSFLKLWIFECRHPSHMAFKLGLSAAMLLVAAHALINLQGGCACVRSKDELVRSKEELVRAPLSKRLPVGSLIFSWIVVVVAFFMLIMGVMPNLKKRGSCRLAHFRQLLIGGVLCFVHGSFGVAYFLSASAARKEEQMGGPSGGTV